MYNLHEEVFETGETNSVELRRIEDRENWQKSLSKYNSSSDALTVAVFKEDIHVSHHDVAEKSTKSESYKYNSNRIVPL